MREDGAVADSDAWCLVNREKEKKRGGGTRRFAVDAVTGSGAGGWGLTRLRER